MIPNLTRLLVSSIGTSAKWVTEAFISYCEMVVRATVRAMIAVIIAIGLIQASIRFDINLLLLLGVAIGGGGLVYFAFVSSLGRMAIEWLSQLSDIAKEEAERLSNIFFLFIVTLFYLGIDQGQRHPTLLMVFLGIMALLFIGAIVPGKGKLMTSFKERFRLLVLVPVVMMTILAAVPEAITKRVTGGHWPEKVTGTVATEIPFRIDEQDQIIDLTTQQPMELFERVSSKGELPEALKGWTRDKKGNYHIYKWFDGQDNYTGVGQEIKPITIIKIDDIVIQTKRVTEDKLVADKKVVNEQKAVADVETARLKAEQENKQEAQRVIDETVRQQRQQAMETARIDRETEREEQRQLALRPISVASTILAPPDQSQNIMVVKPNTPFMYQRTLIQPEESFISCDIVDVKEDSANKNQYILVLQPQMLMFNGVRFNISRQTKTIEVIAKKDNSRSLLKIIATAAGGALVGGIAGGKKGALEGAAVGATAGTIYVMASHGKKFQLTVGDPVPAIIITPTP